MKNCTFKKPFDALFSPERLLYELSILRPIPQDIETIRQEIREGKLFESEPKQNFFLPKSDGTFRTISLSTAKTKIIQRVLATELAGHIKMSDHSYAFRRGKSPAKAIARVQDLLKKYRHMARADIQSFFDTIDQEILIAKLRRIICDGRIVHLIAYYLSMGSLSHQQWVDKSEGIYQGDVLSPLLSNIYLDDFDHWLESQKVEFVRYADDMVFFGTTRSAASHARKLAAGQLTHLRLRFNPRKTYLSSIDEGFEYLGIFFEGDHIRIDPGRLKKKITKLRRSTRKQPLNVAIDTINRKITGYQNYYARLLQDEEQTKQLQESLEAIVVEKIVQAKTDKILTTKAAIHVALEPLMSYTSVHHRHWIDRLISRSYDQLEMTRPLASAKKHVARDKKTFLKKQIKSSEIVVSEPGAFLGFSQGKIKVKLRGKVVAEAPINRVKRILLLNRQSSLSSYLIHACSKHKIDIDFINHDYPFALITYPQQVMPELHLAQLKTYFAPRSLGYAKEIVFTKAKNQINLIKYLNRRRHEERLDHYLTMMMQGYERIRGARDKKVLMGIEGSISVPYWAAFGEILKIEKFSRVYPSAPDAINQALNYGYAILYARVQSALIHEGLNLHYPLYHAIQPNKPTLVYDMVEAFRQPVVDREILALLNRGQKITQSSGRLSKASIKLIVQNIQERLATPTPSRYGKSPLYNIIGFQMNHLKRTLLDRNHYKGFVNKY